MCRALIITSIILAFFGSILVLVGMKCTKLGGSVIINARVTFAGGMNYLVSGKSFVFVRWLVLHISVFSRLKCNNIFHFCFRVVFYGGFFLFWKQIKSRIS